MNIFCRKSDNAFALIEIEQVSYNIVSFWSEVYCALSWDILKFFKMLYISWFWSFFTLLMTLL